MNLIGLVLTAGGFIVTWRQLSQTKTAVEAAKEEAKRIEASIKRYDAAQDAARAGHALVAASKYFKSESWNDGAESYEEVRRALVSIRQNVESLDVIVKKKIDRATIYILRLCEKVDAGEMSSIDVGSKAKLKTIMKQHDELIAEIASAINRDVF